MPEPVSFGRYRLLNLLGEGGMAKVFRAVLAGPMGFEKEVALKRIDTKLTEDERVVKALINEARLGGQLRHKNIVEIYEFNQVDGNYFMAMEYVDGWTLDAVLRSCRTNGTKLPPVIICEMLQYVCRGLDYAHSLVAKDGQPLNLVHRDLKPGNIILSREGDVKIMDFGIAKADTNLYKTTAADVTKGTPIYMSPEQVTGGKLDRRSDLFSMGSILHELTTLQVPFVGDNLLAIMHAILNAEIDEARERVRARVPEFEPILAKCMARNPDERFQTAKEVEKALREVKRELPPGPTLHEWTEDFASHLPEAMATGEFGPDGAPVSLHGAGKPAEGTQSLATVATKDRVGAAKQAERVPEVSVGDDLFDSFGDTVAVGAEGDRDGRLNEEEASFFDTDGAAPARTRIQKGVGAGGPKQLRKTGGKRRKKKKSNAPLYAVAAILVGVIVAVGVLLITQLGGDPATGGDPGTAVTTEDPTAATSPEEAPSPAEAAGDEDALPSLAIEEPATPASATPPKEPSTPKPKPVAETKPPREPRTPKPEAKPPREPSTPKPTPVADKPPVEAAPPAPAVVGTGTVSFNSKPWSTVIVDGRVLGSTPVQNHTLSAGDHTVVFDCSACSPPDKKTLTVTVQAGQATKKIVRF